MARISLDEIRELSVAERLRLLEDIWDTISASPDALPVTEEQRQELDRRVKLHKEEPEAASPWSEVRSRITREE